MENIRSQIGAFAGYDDERKRYLADEQIRAFVGERLAALPAVEVDTLTAEERACYDRVLLRAEFINHDVFRVFDDHPGPSQIAAVLQADDELIAAAKDLEGADGAGVSAALARVEAAFDRRDQAMAHPC